MTKVVLQDAETVAVLDALRQRAEICDPAGRVLGYYVPREADSFTTRGRNLRSARRNWSGALVTTKMPYRCQNSGTA